MTRLQISDQFGQQRLQTQAQPNTPTEAAPAPVQETAWKSLANALDGGASVAEQMRLKQEEDDRNAAKRYAQSMTVGELHKKIVGGEMMPSQSPVFAATVQHIWGENSHESLQRDTISKLSTGELKFKSTAEADTYLTEARNTALSGQGKYAVAGFDKGFSQLRDKLMGEVNKNNDATQVAAATVQAGDSLANTLNKVSGPDFKGTPQEAAQDIMGQYQLMLKTSVLPAAASKAALKDVLTRAAGAGKQSVVDAVLDSQLPDIGSVRGFIGSDHAQTLSNHAGTVYDGQQRQRIDTETLPWMQQADTGDLKVDNFMAWAQGLANSKYASAASIHGILAHNQSSIAARQRLLQKSATDGAVQASEYAAQRAVDAKLSSGTLWEVQGTNNPMTLTHTGEPKKFDVKAYAEKALVAKTAGLPMDQQVSAWAMNGLTNPDWRNQLQAGLFNLNSIGLATSGKPAGQLNEPGRNAIELFRQLNLINPDAAKHTAGDEGFKRFSDIGFLMHFGRSAEDAASIAASAAPGGAGADAGFPKKVSAEVSKMFDVRWMDWLDDKSNQALDVLDEVRRIGPTALHLVDSVNPYHLLPGYTEFVGGVAPKPVGTVSRTVHNTTGNTAQVHGWVNRYATLLAHSGQFGTAEAAIKAAADYIADPKVSARINGTLYLRSELPATPSPTRTPEQWFELFLEGPKARAKELGFPGSEVRLEYDERSNVYRAFVGGLPMSQRGGGGIMAFQKGAIESWFAVREQQDIAAAAHKAMQPKPPSASGRANRQTLESNRFGQPLAPKPDTQ